MNQSGSVSSSAVRGEANTIHASATWTTLSGFNKLPSSRGALDGSWSERASIGHRTVGGEGGPVHRCRIDECYAGVLVGLVMSSKVISPYRLLRCIVAFLSLLSFPRATVPSRFRRQGIDSSLHRAGPDLSNPAPTHVREITVHHGPPRCPTSPRTTRQTSSSSDDFVFDSLPPVAARLRSIRSANAQIND